MMENQFFNSMHRSCSESRNRMMATVEKTYEETVVFLDQSLDHSPNREEQFQILANLIFSRKNVEFTLARQHGNSRLFSVSEI